MKGGVRPSTGVTQLEAEGRGQTGHKGSCWSSVCPEAHPALGETRMQGGQDTSHGAPGASRTSLGSSHTRDADVLFACYEVQHDFPNHNTCSSSVAFSVTNFLLAKFYTEQG